MKLRVSLGGGKYRPVRVSAEFARSVRFPQHEVTLVAISVLLEANREESAKQQSDQTNVRTKQRANRARGLRRVKMRNTRCDRCFPLCSRTRTLLDAVGMSQTCA